jgi:hypothetical protein
MHTGYRLCETSSDRVELPAPASGVQMFTPEQRKRYRCNGQARRGPLARELYSSLPYLASCRLLVSTSPSAKRLASHRSGLILLHISYVENSTESSGFAVWTDPPLRSELIPLTTTTVVTKPSSVRGAHASGASLVSRVLPTASRRIDRRHLLSRLRRLQR